MSQLSEEDVRALIEGMRARGELHFTSAEEVRQACAVLSREDLVEVIVADWRRRVREKLS